MLAFITPSDFDLASLTTFGLSAKPASDSPIGYFGTGLKYAFATLLRNGCEIEISTPSATYTVVTESIDFRGASHSRLYLETYREACSERIALPFTLDLGKNWTPLMAYRELESNTRDEQGVTIASPEALAAYRRQHDTSQSTMILVSGKTIDEAFAQRDQMFLSISSYGKPLWANANLEVYPAKPSDHIQVFYRGVSVLRSNDGQKPAFVYNLLSEVKLTEDRTLDFYSAAYRIASETWGNKDFPFELFEKVLHNNRGLEVVYSSNLCLEHANKMLDLFDAGEVKFHLDHINTARHLTGRKFRPRPTAIDATYQSQLDAALSILAQNRIEVTTPIFIIESNPQFTGLASHDDTAIYLTLEAFEQGQIYLIGTIYEEHLHITKGFQDETRKFQDYLIDKIARMFFLSARKGA
jgi:hypothetical protein